MINEKLMINEWTAELLPDSVRIYWRESPKDRNNSMWRRHIESILQHELQLSIREFLKKKESELKEKYK